MKLTKSSVAALAACGKRCVYRDDMTPGLVLRMGETGHKAFYFVYAAGKGRGACKRWVRLGTWPGMSADQARERARQLMAQVVMGGDPAEDMRQARTAITIAEGIAEYLDEQNGKLKSKSLSDYKNIAENIILPAIGKARIDDIATRQIMQIHHARRRTPYLANKTMAVLSGFFRWAEKAGYREKGSNPVAGVQKYREEKRRKFMDKTEIEALGRGLALLEAKKAINPLAAAAFRLLIFTGARCGEILSLRWEYVDFEAGVARLPDSKTGAKTLILPGPALNVLRDLPRFAGYCFPGRDGGHIKSIHRPWKALCEAAGLEGWRIHDLRHAYASCAANAGQSLPIIGQILGHSQTSTTARYAHLADSPVRQAATETATRLLSHLSNGKILPFKRASSDDF